MSERAAHLVDDVWPDVPVRQRVLSLPPRVWYRLAWHHDLCKAVAGVLHRGCTATCGRGTGTRPRRSRGGATIIVQRFGGALNLNVHLHAIVLDGRMSTHEEVRQAIESWQLPALQPSPRLTSPCDEPAWLGETPSIRATSDTPRGLAAALW